MLKKKVISIMLLALGLSLVGCETREITLIQNNNSKLETETITDIDNEISSETSTSTSNTSIKNEENVLAETKTSESNVSETSNNVNIEKNRSVVDNSGAVTQKELQKNQDYFNKIENNGFLCSEYNSVKDISLVQLVYNGAGIDEKMTEEEKADYKDEIYTDIIKIPRKALEEVTKSKLNIELTSINGYEEFKKNYYSEKYDCYYLQHGDTNYQQVEFLSGEKNDDGTYTFIYNGYSHTTFTQQEFKLKCYINNDVYTIISNIPNN